uniref:Uncharacterized protein n=1 Tax=Oryza punctata TaxID=4537 RepID=A0A0E0L5Y8_ORYPU
MYLADAPTITSTSTASEVSARVADEYFTVDVSTETQCKSGGTIARGMSYFLLMIKQMVGLFLLVWIKKEAT